MPVASPSLAVTRGRRRAAGFAIALLALAIGAAVVSRPDLALLGFGALAAAVSALFNPGILIGAHTLFCMLGEPWGLANQSFSVSGLDLFATDLLVLALSGAWLLDALRRGRHPARPRDPISVVMALYLLYGLFSLARGWGLHGREALPGFRMQFVYALLFCLSLWALARPAARRALLVSVIAGAVLVSLLGFFNALTGHHVGWTTSSHTYRYLSGLQALAAFAGLALIAGYIWSAARPGWSLILGGLCLAAVLLSQARSVWLGAAIALAVVVAGASAMMRRRLLRQLPLVATVALIALVAVLALNLGLTEDLATRAASLAEVSTDLTTVWRLYVWGEALTQLSSSPLLGLGLGQPFVYFDIVEGNWQTGRQLHNSHLELAFYTGFLGAAILVLFQVIVLLRTLRAARRAGGTPQEGRLLSLAACQVCLAGVSFTNVISSSLVSTHYLWILSAAAVLEAASGNGSYRRSSPRSTAASALRHS